MGALPRARPTGCCWCSLSASVPGPPPTCALPTVDREGGRLAGQGVPAGRPRPACVPRGRSHPAPLALPRAEVLLPHVRGPAHRGALQHHPRSAPAGPAAPEGGGAPGLHCLGQSCPRGSRSRVDSPAGVGVGVGDGAPRSARGSEGGRQPGAQWVFLRRGHGCSPASPAAWGCVWVRGRPLPADFPDSRPAVEDLKYCLERTDQRQQLLVSLKAALETRLLHPGTGRPPADLRAQNRG